MTTVAVVTHLRAKCIFRELARSNKTQLLCLFLLHIYRTEERE